MPAGRGELASTPKPRTKLATFARPTNTQLSVGTKLYRKCVSQLSNYLFKLQHTCKLTLQVLLD